MSKRKAKVPVNAVEDDDATQLSGREAQRIAGLNADHAAAGKASGIKRKETAMSRDEKLAKQASHKREVRMKKAAAKAATAAARQAAQAEEAKAAAAAAAAKAAAAAAAAAEEAAVSAHAQYAAHLQAKAQRAEEALLQPRHAPYFHTIFADSDSTAVHAGTLYSTLYSTRLDSTLLYSTLRSLSLSACVCRRLAIRGE